MKHIVSHCIIRMLRDQFQRGCSSFPCMTKKISTESLRYLLGLFECSRAFCRRMWLQRINCSTISSSWPNSWHRLFMINNYGQESGGFHLMSNLLPRKILGGSDLKLSLSSVVAFDWSINLTLKSSNVDGRWVSPIFHIASWESIH